MLAMDAEMATEKIRESRGAMWLICWEHYFWSGDVRSTCEDI